MTVHLCSACAFRRPRISVRDMLASLNVPIVNLLGATIDQLETWLDEQKSQELATVQRIVDDGSGTDWPRRPRAHDYCGFIGDRPRVLELVNPTGACPAHSPEPRPSRPCDTCKWLIRPHDATAAIAASAGGSQSSLTFAQRAADVAEGLARSEVIDAVKQGGVIREKPRYLPVCGRLSTADRTIVGPIANWTHACGYWNDTAAP